jgi:type IV pilus assembly protein PilB
MNLPPQVVKDILVKNGYVNEKEFDEIALSSQSLGKSLEDSLIFKGIISSEILSELIAKYLHVPYTNLSHLSIPTEVLSLIPENLAQTYRMVPFARKADELLLAMEDPRNIEAIEFAKRHTGLIISPHYASHEEITQALNQYKKDIKKDYETVISENLKKAQLGKKLEEVAEDIPIIKILDTILEYAVAERASDVHIEVQEKDVIIRFRIDGVLKDILRLPKEAQDALVARVKILSNLKLDEHRIPQDGRYKIKVSASLIALRISIIPSFYGENIVMRLLKESARPQSLEELGIAGRNLKVLQENIKKPYGMILVTGPTGSGKTTTLYSILNILNTTKVKIATIEDPIEYGIQRITQIQVNPKTGLTFAAGLRALLRHDPDIMMVGEIRDKETAEIAIHSALTGHLLLSTLHTNDAIGALPRLIDMGVEAYLASSTLNVVLAQRLVRRICKYCIVQDTPQKAILEKLKNELQINPQTCKFYKGKGCSKCANSGYSGRIGIYEVLNITDSIKDLVLKKASNEQILSLAKKEGMTTMFEDGIDKVAAGQTTIDEVLKAVLEK